MQYPPSRQSIFSSNPSAQGLIYTCNSSDSDNWSTIARAGSHIPTLPVPCLGSCDYDFTSPLQGTHAPDDKIKSGASDVYGTGMQFPDDMWAPSFLNIPFHMPPFLLLLLTGVMDCFKCRCQPPKHDP